jgi:predicted acyltransferase (DUF342 family)
MTYTINNTRGSVVTTVADGTIDSSTSIKLIGKNTASYGEVLNENFVGLLENFASPANGSGVPTYITSPLVGQLWWDTTNNTLKAYNGSTWKSIASSKSSPVSSPPTGVVTGDMWWDTTNAQLKTYNGSGWTTIGPAFTAAAGTSGALVESLRDALQADHTVVSLYAGSQRIAIVSKDDEFTPLANQPGGVPSVSGFTTVKPGINLAATSVIPNNGFTGLATNSNQLDSLDSTDFMRSTANTATTGTVAINNNGGLSIGIDGVSPASKISYAGGKVTFENLINTGTMELKVRQADGTQWSAIQIESVGNITMPRSLTIGSQGNLAISSTTAATNTTTGSFVTAGGAGIAGNLFVGANANVTGNVNVTGNLAVTGGFTLTGTQTFNGNVTLGDATADQITVNGVVNSNILPAANATYTIGNSTLQWSNIYAVTFTGKATNAQYADLAERYAADREYPPGTVVSIGGDAEVTVATLNTDVFGVVSTDPAYLMNAKAGTNATHPPVALIGRVPVRVQGPASKGDKLVVGPAGVAIRYVPDVSPDPENYEVAELSQDKLVGRALTDKYSEEIGLLEVVLAAH